MKKDNSNDFPKMLYAEPGEVDLEESEVVKIIQHYNKPFMIKTVYSESEEKKERARGWLGDPQEVKTVMEAKRKKPGRPPKEEKDK